MEGLTFDRRGIGKSDGYCWFAYTLGKQEFAKWLPVNY
nr:MAG TPA: Prolyl oligopeptidase family [Caudoviricetes sp.]